MHDYVAIAFKKQPTVDATHTGASAVGIVRGGEKAINIRNIISRSFFTMIR